MTEKYAQQPPCTAPELLLKLVLSGTQSHYENRGIIDDKRLEHLLHAGKQILFKSHQESNVRQNLGFSPAVWQGLTAVLSAAIPELEQLCFIYRNSDPAAFNNSSSELVAANCFTLVKEIERLNDLCTIARNLLATTKKAQNLAADRGFDQQVLKLIDVCVKVTARGFDGTNVRVEERHQKVCNLFKRLLITCLQFLHNFIMHNEHRKLVLWLDLFGNAAQQSLAADGSRGDSALEVREVSEAKRVQGDEESRANITQDSTANAVPAFDVHEVEQLIAEQQAKRSLPYTIADVTALFDVLGGQGSTDKRTHDAAKVLMERIKSDMERLSGMSADQLDENPEILLKVGAALRAQLASKDAALKPSLEDIAKSFSNNKLPVYNRAGQLSGLPDITNYSNFSTDQNITEDDLAMPRTSLSAAETLQEAKDELMARLQDNTPLPGEHDDQPFEGEHQQEEEADDELVDDADESIDDDVEGDEEDYHNPNDQERGLLTDIPLVLGPTEIEALPMIIQAGIVDNFGSVKNVGDRQGAKNMQAVRCHILLAQEAGRNVLRELLIFIAAWDLPDDEFYFKMMVQIMEAILKNGLMSHAYSDFGQAKDIISPAQAVVIKILTHIFRSKYSPSSQNNAERPASRPKTVAPLSRVDILTVRYIFTVFRGNIIPETCALIYLQGQIRGGLAMAEDFPLNLWDMERVYEGVYQFLEFFAVLTENNDWKRLLVEWEIVYDLVTLLKELDASIPKAPLMVPRNGQVESTGSKKIAQTTTTSKSHLTIERPYDAADTPPAQPPSPAVPTLPTQSQALTHSGSSRSQSPPPPTSSEDPSTFEWRNLKKLIVLVLSSLVWKNTHVQNQIREHSGVETILSCTNYDGHNPYIKEHAVMCLKFLLEGNAENQAIVRDLEARGIANQDGIEKDYGVQARIEDGRVKVTSTTNPSGISNSHQDNSNKRNRGERARRIARRASESNAAAELLGDRFADLNIKNNHEDDVERFNDGHDDHENDHNDGNDEIEFM